MAYTLEWALDHEASYRYQLLDRMRLDCDYYLGNGQIYGNHLWAGNDNIDDQIAIMRALWNSFPDDGKPKWLSWEEIQDYETKMKEIAARKAAKAAKTG